MKIFDQAERDMVRYRCQLMTRTEHDLERQRLYLSDLIEHTLSQSSRLQFTPVTLLQLPLTRSDYQTLRAHQEEVCVTLMRRLKEYGDVWIDISTAGTDLVITGKILK